MKTSAVLFLGCGLVTEAFVNPSTNVLHKAPLQNVQSTKQSSGLYMSSTVSTDTTESKSEAASQNLFGVASDAATGLIFSALHAFDDCGIEDSSKNLRVLWVRALLAFRNKIDDEVAKTFLPSATRSLVTTELGAKLLDPILPFAEWIEARTDFIDTSLDQFLANPLCTDSETGEKLECNVVLFGAGYDTRALRYRHKHGNKANFIEVDLPSVVDGKRKLYEKFQREQDPEWDLQKYGSKLIAFDLNDAGGPNPRSLIETLREEGGLKKDVPTFFVSEAVLFYVNEDAVSNIMKEFFDFSKPGGNGNSDKAETLVCFTDSLKPFVDVPFTIETRKWFDKNGMDLLQHRARWGGAVHFALAGSRKLADTSKTEATEDPEASKGVIGKYISSEVGGLIMSYIPTAARNTKILEKPSFENVWYSVAFPWQIDGYDTPLDAVLKRKSKNGKTAKKPFATRLWGEPIVIYRDGQGDLVGMADVCPHRSAPLSMGTIEDGKLSCLYHGWKFGEKGSCVDVPTLHTVDDEGNEVNRGQDTYLKGVTKSNSGNLRAVVEHEGMVYVWRGNILEADLSLLPQRRKGDMGTVPIDTVLDYSVDYSYIVENNLDSPHLMYLHDGSIPPIESIGMMNSNLPRLRLNSFTDDCGMGHLGRFGVKGRPKKILRFDPPNIVRHGGVSCFEEEFHCVPIAPQRTRVLLRQHLPKGPILSTVTSIPGMMSVLTVLVNCWNYQIALEDSNVMQGQASRIEDWGSPRVNVGGLGDDLIKRYWKWRSLSHKDLMENHQVDSPYYSKFMKGVGMTKPTGLVPTGTSYGDDPSLIAKVKANAKTMNTLLVSDDQGIDERGNSIGTWGIKQDYIQELPAANFPPMNYKQYANLLAYDEFVKGLIKKDEDATETIPQGIAQCPAPAQIE